MLSPRIVRGLKRAPGAIALGLLLHLRLLGAAIFVDRVYVTALFLLLATPYLVIYGAYARIRPSARTTKSSPFIYTMQ